MTYGTKENILANLKTVITAIKKASGYNNDIAYVDRQYQEMGNYEYPATFINDIREINTKVLKDLISVDLTIQVICFVHAETNVSTELNKFLEDVAKAITVDTTRGGEAKRTDITDIDVDSSFMIPHGVGIMTLRIHYYKEGLA